MIVLTVFYLNLIADLNSSEAAKVGKYCSLTAFFAVFILTKAVKNRLQFNSYICSTDNNTSN